jgi:hypothetical protein
VLFKKRGAWNRCIKHKLMEICFVGDGIIDNLADILRRMMNVNYNSRLTSIIIPGIKN